MLPAQRRSRAPSRKEVCGATSCNSLFGVSQRRTEYSSQTTLQPLCQTASVLFLDQPQINQLLHQISDFAFSIFSAALKLQGAILDGGFVCFVKKGYLHRNPAQSSVREAVQSDTGQRTRRLKTWSLSWCFSCCRYNCRHINCWWPHGCCIRLCRHWGNARRTNWRDAGLCTGIGCSLFGVKRCLCRRLLRRCC